MKKDLDSELKFVGFALSVLLVAGIVFSFVLLLISCHPQLLLGSGTPQQNEIASKMAIILAASVPISVLQRCLLTAFEIRLESYLSNRVMTASSLLTLLGGIFFLKERYDVIGYFGYSQVLLLCATLVCYWLAVKRYGYSLSSLLIHIRFDRDVYSKIKDLSYTGMFQMAFWVLFYELDQIVIAHAFGASSVAMFAISASIAGYLRVGIGTAYSPFLARANHYIGAGDVQGLQGMIDRVMMLFSPIVVFLCIIIAAFARLFIYSWVGGEYSASIHLVQMIALQFSLSVVAYPVGVILVSKVETKQLRYVSLLQPIGYWLVVISLMGDRGIAAFVEARVFVLFVTFAYYLVILKRFFGIGIWDLVHRYFLSFAFSGIVLGGASIWIASLFRVHKSKEILLVVMACCVGLMGSALLLQYGCSEKSRQLIRSILPSRGNRKALND